MYSAFVRLLNMSLAAGMITVIVVVLRLILRKLPKKFICLLWAIVAFRLLLPFSPSSELSAFNLINSPVNSGQIEYFRYSGHSEKPTVEFSATGSALDVASDPGRTFDAYLPTVMKVWLVGSAAMLFYALISYIRLKRSVRASISVRDNIMACDEVSSPFILGIVRPVIYVPSALKGEALSCVIIHEAAHIRRRDHWWKPLGFLLLTVHWFNPTIWLAYVLLCRDIEMACDEKVIRDMNKEGRATYSQTLLDCSFKRRSVTACPLAFGEVGVKERVRSVLNYKKPAFWLVILAVVILTLLTVCFLTNPAADIGGKLGVSMDMAVAGHSPPAKYEDDFIITDYDVLRVSKAGSTATVYAWVLFEEYSFDGTEIQIEQGSHIPTVVTFDMSDKSSSAYSVLEYWEPRDGSYYADDIRSKFPITLWKKAFDGACFAEQDAKCRYAAEKHFRGDFETEEYTADHIITWAERPMLRINEQFYVAPYMPVSQLPEGYAPAGRLTGEQAHNTDLAGLIYYTASDEADFYTYQECGTPINQNTIDSEARQWAYIQWIPLTEEEKADEDEKRFYLTVGKEAAQNVYSILITTPDFSGGCQNADGSPFKRGERIYLECLDGLADLRGVSFTALDENGEIVWSSAVPDTEDNRGFTLLSVDGWTIADGH